MKIFITGGTGFVGRTLVRHLLDSGHQVTLLTRAATSGTGATGNPRLLQGDPTKPGSWQEKLRTHEAAINLAGSSIFCRWNRENRQRILDSRILSTRNIVTALTPPGSMIKVLLNGSA
ncbi:MAG TPA: NAD-dependent epimerase/dehydratase family protein, partial [Desulfurivibrionaceae bacterium]|nr:NAD-dependent epimerase/dehydratase family protein [Desulfurivibrionaceae bacterium]